MVAQTQTQKLLVVTFLAWLFGFMTPFMFRIY